MSTTILSSAHSLQLIDLNRLSIFTVVGSRVILSFLPGEKGLLIIPGTVAITSGISDNAYDKEIRCLSSVSGYRMADYLFRFSRRRLIAIYTDERGEQRVAGSPEYPLSLEYTITDGVATIILKGRSDREDGYLMVG